MTVRGALRLGLVGLTLAGCPSARVPVAPPARSLASELRKLPRLEDPPAVALALEPRLREPVRALELLAAAYDEALRAGDARTQAFCFNRAGDVTMDLAAEWTPALPALEPRVREQPDACAAALYYYRRAWEVAEPAAEPRLLGRIAHDLAWAREQCRDDETAKAWYAKALELRLTAHDASGVQYSANNFGRLLIHPKLRRLELYELALHAARVLQDRRAERKVQSNIARLWFFSADDSWLVTPDAGTEYAGGPPRGEPRRQFLLHLDAALAAGREAGEPVADVCEGLQLPGTDCSTWLDQTAAEFFPEPP